MKKGNVLLRSYFSITSPILRSYIFAAKHWLKHNKSLSQLNLLQNQYSFHSMKWTCYVSSTLLCTLHSSVCFKLVEEIGIWNLQFYQHFCCGYKLVIKLRTLYMDSVLGGVWGWTHTKNLSENIHKQPWSQKWYILVARLTYRQDGYDLSHNNQYGIWVN